MPRYLELRVSLWDIKPEIWRRFLLPDNATFEDLHEAIQDSFGWEYDHLYEFRDKKGRDTIARAEFDEDFSENGDVPTTDELKLPSFFKRSSTKCVYVYDFGDNWKHVVELVKAVELPERFKRRLLDGARACPLEDCGGVYGYYECVRVAGMSEEDIEKADEPGDIGERKEWMGDWDPEAFDLKKVKKKFDK